MVETRKVIYVETYYLIAVFGEKNKDIIVVVIRFGEVIVVRRISLMDDRKLVFSPC